MTEMHYWSIRELSQRIRSGEISPVAVVKAPEPTPRLLSESLRLIRERGSTVTLDGGFVKDVEEFIESHREPLDPPAWD